MARRLISLICLLSLAVSCTPAPQQQVAVATATSFTATATLALLETSAATPSATSSMIHAPTATLTVIDTSTVTPTSTYMPTADRVSDIDAFASNRNAASHADRDSQTEPGRFFGRLLAD